MAAGGGGRFQSCEREQSGAATFDRFVKWSYLCLPSPSRLQPLGGRFRSSWVVLRVPSRKRGLVHLVVEGSHSDLTGKSVVSKYDTRWARPRAVVGGTLEPGRIFLAG